MTPLVEVERVVVLVEENGQGWHGLASLRRMSPIIQANADDLLRMGHARSVFDLVLAQKEAIGLGGLGPINQALEGWSTASLEDLRNRGGCLLFKGRLRLADVENTAVGLDAQALILASPDGDKSHPTRHLARGGLTAWRCRSGHEGYRWTKHPGGDGESCGLGSCSPSWSCAGRGAFG